MIRRRAVLAVALLALGVVAALLAADLRSWQDAIRAGDLRFQADPPSAGWQASTRLPFDPAGRILGVGGELAFRRGAQGFEAVLAAGNGFDNGVSEVQTRGEAEAALTDLSHAANAQHASAADNLAGILAFSDSRQNGANAPAPVDRSVADFEDALRRDPANDDAKFNLELLLRQLVAKGVRPGTASSPRGGAKGHRGAGAGLPGRGY